MLTGQRILVTGAASGLGLAICQGLADAGAALAMSDREPFRLSGKFDNAKPYLANLLEVEEIESLVAQVGADGAIDGLVNCAGVYPLTPLLDLDADEWDEVLGVNLRAPFILSQAVARTMIKAGTSGSIVNVSSTASTLVRPGISHYGASKAGLNQLTRIMAAELAPYDIRINAVLPGVIATERVKGTGATPQGQADLKAKLERIPMDRLGQPEEVVPLVTMLLSENASYCTGALFTVDGGYSLGIART